MRTRSPYETPSRGAPSVRRAHDRPVEVARHDDVLGGGRSAVCARVVAGINAEIKRYVRRSVSDCCVFLVRLSGARAGTT